MKNETAFLSGQALLSSLKTNYHVFADEIDKFFYLRTLKSTLKDQGCIVLSFALLDDSLNVLTVTESVKILPDELILTGFHQDFLPVFTKRHPDWPKVRPETGHSIVCGFDRVLEEVNHLHFLPVELGIVRCTDDYFWSGAQTYSERYLWDFMEPEYLLSAFGKDSRAARRLFRDAARKQFQKEFKKK